MHLYIDTRILQHRRGAAKKKADKLEAASPTRSPIGVVAKKGICDNLYVWQRTTKERGSHRRGALPVHVPSEGS